MPPGRAFAERLATLFELELRRQGVPGAEEWVDRLRTYSSYVPTNATVSGVRQRSSSPSSPSSSSPTAPCVFVLDVSHLVLGDRVAVALCESLLKVETPNARVSTSGAGAYNSVIEWHLMLRRCRLTDRVVHHLSLLLLGCPKLTVLDVSANDFTEAGRTYLLHAAAEVPCDLIVVDNNNSSNAREHSSNSSGTISMDHRNQPPREISPPSSSALRSPWLKPSATRRSEGRPHVLVARPSLMEGTHAGGAAAPAATSCHSSPHNLPPATELRNPQSPCSTAQQQPQQQPQQHHQRQQLQRSPSSLTTTTTTASFARSQRSYPSGSAEALQRRRAELFGHSTPVSSSLAADAAATPAAATSSLVSPDNSRSAETNVARHPSPPPAASPAVVTAAVSSSSSPLPVQPPAASTTASTTTMVAAAAESAEAGADNDDRGGDGSHSPFRTTVTAPRTPSEQSRPADVVRQLCGGSDSSAREPFVDRNDQLDVTANLNPLLDSVVDLSALTGGDGVLRQVHMYGGARTVWDVLEAYEQAAEQQQHGSSSGSSSSVAAALRAKLPAVILGCTTYNVITVLNLSRNHLTSLCPLPATLLRLDVSANALTELSGLEPCRMLAVLNARRNRLHAIRGLEKNLSLAHLFLGHNDIALIEGLAHLVLLETLDVTFNKLRTQASLRMLSLCSALRHLLLRGNPVVEGGKPGITAVLRNLCPTLLVVDEQRVGSTTLAERAMQHRGWGQPPNTISATTRANDNNSSRGPATSPSSALLQVAVSAISGDGGRVEGGSSTAAAMVRASSSSLSSSFVFTASRRRCGSSNGGYPRPAPFAAAADNDSNTVDARSLDLLHMLTRGVTAPTGYGDAAMTQHTAKHLARLHRAAQAKEQAQKARRLTANGRPLRRAVVQHLAEESRRYVEDTIVRRLTAQQSLLLSPNRTSRGGGDVDVDADDGDGVFTPSARTSAAVEVREEGGGGTADTTGERNFASSASAETTSPSPLPHRSQQQQHCPLHGTEVAGSVDYPARAASAKRATMPSTTTATTAAAAAAAAVQDPATAAVLKRYELRTKPLHRRPAASAAATRQPYVATTHAAQLRAESARRSVSSSASRGQSPARASSGSITPTPTTVAAPGAAAAAAASTTTSPGKKRGPTDPHRGPGGSQTSSQHQQQHPNGSGAVDATLDAIYVEETPDNYRRGRDDLYAAAVTAAARRETAVNSYAALHLADTQAISATAAATVTTTKTTTKTTLMTDSAEIECSPISKDPQARLVTSLNTTAPVYERSDHRDVLPTPPSSSSTATRLQRHQQTYRTKSSERQHDFYNVPPALTSGPRTGARHTDPREALTTTATQQQQRGGGASAAGGGPRDPADVEETAIYAGSRSHSRASRGAASHVSSTPRTATAAATAPEVGRQPSEQAHSGSTPTSRSTPRRSQSREGRSSSSGRATDAQQAALAASASSSSSRSRSRSASLQPLHIDAAQRNRVQAWSRQLADDTVAVQEALLTLVELLEAQRQPDQQPFPESSRELPPTYLQERQRCLEIVQGSGMLADTQVPMEVVVYYGFRRRELDGEVDRSADVVPRDGKSEQAWMAEVSERAEVLRLVHLLGDAKTCLRYVALLIGDGRERLLQQYVDQLRESLRT
jgi:hypothetical protein